MRSVSGREFCRVLEQNGWRLVRVSGSHHVYEEEGRPRRISVPVDGGKVVRPGLLRRLLKDAGLTEDDL